MAIVFAATIASLKPIRKFFENLKLDFYRVRVLQSMSCPKHESSIVRVLLGMSSPGYEFSRVRVLQQLSNLCTPNNTSG